MGKSLIQVWGDGLKVWWTRYQGQMADLMGIKENLQINLHLIKRYQDQCQDQNLSPWINQD